MTSYYQDNKRVMKLIWTGTFSPSRAGEFFFVTVFWGYLLD